MKRFFLGVMLTAAATLATVNAQTIAQRRENQQDRIAQGVASGQLTAGETARLERQQARIHRQVHRDRVVNGGRLTAGERRQVHRELNHTSWEIARDKHNARIQRP